MSILDRFRRKNQTTAPTQQNGSTDKAPRPVTRPASTYQAPYTPRPRTDTTPVTAYSPASYDTGSSGCSSSSSSGSDSGGGDCGGF